MAVVIDSPASCYKRLTSFFREFNIDTATIARLIFKWGIDDSGYQSKPEECNRDLFATLGN
ncbi:MAG TPA: hypothetical protein VHE99_12890 [Gammaproteobacteria bacterium]|nr:hypothetical protein [Gammaproteobacteria bacterium]